MKAMRRTERLVLSTPMHQHQNQPTKVQLLDLATRRKRASRAGRLPQFGSPLSGIGWCIRHNGCPALCDTSSADDEHATRTPLLSEKHPISHYLEMSDGLYVAAVGPRRSTTGRGSLIGGAGRLGAVIGGPKGLIAQLLLEHHEG